ncbi:hypothetical protein SpiGrapes_1216 [Sphaerochaeta pleomorpha str. Grapes]|uniref:Outer membrane protein beta-barrel domain-containing protein n=1 Tax=Sphaerochaeta pleomorpha (strain ATCC BAA-1885 / DSM 22778 / Grapes) TaxID=158190 RepID=G8QT66_SPHPG|nr:hypothetical protein [Sphaerochaeta pleomorpha]AEV29033.1 hypothetical protein SpiGrapes_1216 [Sphaerochaeta pleomorpha str. Grapes]
MNRKLIAMLLAVVLIPATLFAMPVVVTWEWMVEDPMVTTFRYQVDGEEASAWIVVDSSVTSFTLKGVDGSVAHTLYLQQSYDGVNFSASSMSSSEPILEEVPETPVVEVAAVAEVVTPVAEEVPVIEQAPAVVEEIAPVIEEPVSEVQAAEVQPAVAATAVVAEAAPVEMKENRYSTTITLGGGALYSRDSIGSYGQYVPVISLGLDFNNLITLNKSFGIGAEMVVSYDPFLNGSWSTFLKNIFSDFSTTFNTLTQVGSISVMPKLDIALGKVDVALGGGGFLFYSLSDNLISQKYMYGAFAKMSLSYKLNSWFSLGLSGSYLWVLNDTTNPQIINGALFMGFSF